MGYHFAQSLQYVSSSRERRRTAIVSFSGRSYETEPEVSRPDVARPRKREDLAAIADAKPEAVLLVPIEEKRYVGCGANGLLVQTAECITKEALADAVRAGSLRYMVRHPAIDHDPLIPPGLWSLTRTLGDPLAHRCMAQKIITDYNIVEKAKSKIMSEKDLAEPQAYAMLRRVAMNCQASIATVAKVYLETR